MSLCAATTRKGEKFLDPESVVLHSSDFSFEEWQQHIIKNGLLLCKKDSEQKDETPPNQPLEETTGGISCANPWEQFYVQNQNHFFPIKNYILQAFPRRLLHSTQPPAVILDAGCGSGSGILPIMRHRPKDSTAVRLLRDHDTVSSLGIRLTTLTVDLSTCSRIPLDVSADIILLTFVLCALPSAQARAHAVQALRKACHPGSVVLFRDYAIYDNGHVRFAQAGAPEVEPAPYVTFAKRDHTTQHYFELSEVRQLFLHNGFAESVCPEEALGYHCNRVVNRKTRVSMSKVFLNGVLVAI